MRDAFDITVIILGAIIGCLAGGAMATELLYAFVERVMPDSEPILLGITLIVVGGAAGLYLGAVGARHLISGG